MNAHEKALERVARIFPPPFTRPHGVVNEYLAALPSSIVVDGKVVGLEAAWTEMGLRHEGGYPELWELLDAAREVAE